MSQRGNRKRALRAAHVARVRVQSKAEFYLTFGGLRSLRHPKARQLRFYQQAAVDANHAQLGRDWV